MAGTGKRKRKDAAEINLKCIDHNSADSLKDAAIGNVERSISVRTHITCYRDLAADDLLRTAHGHAAQVSTGKDPLSISSGVIVCHSGIKTFVKDGDTSADCIGREGKSTAVFAAFDHGSGIGIIIEGTEFPKGCAAAVAEDDFTGNSERGNIFGISTVEGVLATESQIGGGNVGIDGAVVSADGKISVRTGIDA